MSFFLYLLLMDPDGTVHLLRELLSSMPVLLGGYVLGLLLASERQAAGKPMLVDDPSADDDAGGEEIDTDRLVLARLGFADAWDRWVRGETGDFEHEFERAIEHLECATEGLP